MLSALITAFVLASTPQADYRARFPLPGPAVPDGWGVNVHLRDAEPKEYDLMRDLGVKWARLDMLWGRVERQPGVYDFSEYDAILSQLRARNIRPLVILDYGNKVYGVDSHRTREGRTAFAAYALEAVRRYRGRGIVWEIWNEPNLRRFWQAEPSAAEYAALVRVVGESVRTYAPQEWLVGPGISRFDWPFLKELLEEGALKYLDAITIHPYRDSRPPETVLPEWQRLRALLDRHTPTGKSIPLISGEWGYSTTTKTITPEKQAQYAVRQYLTNIAAGVNLNIWYCWRDRGSDPLEKEHNFGVITESLELKPAYQAIQTTIRSLNGYTYESRVDLGSEFDHALLFRKGTRRKLAIWSHNPRPQQAVIPATAGQFVLPGGGVIRNRTIQLRNTVQILEQR